MAMFRPPICWPGGSTVYRHQLRKAGAPVSAGRFGLYLCAKAINPHVGFMVGWSSLLDYLFLPMINVLLAKIYLSALFPGCAMDLGGDVRRDPHRGQSEKR